MHGSVFQFVDEFAVKPDEKYDRRGDLQGDEFCLDQDG